MKTIIAGARRFHVNCIVFDKDGTLIDFNKTWARRTADWILAMRAQVNDPAFPENLSRTLGFNWSKKEVLPDSPLTVTTAVKLIALASGEIYKTGLPWHDAEKIAIETIIPTLGADFQDGEIEPLGDVRGTFQKLKQAGFQIAIATGDDRKPTGEVLRALAITELVDAVVCADDHLPEKPDAAVLQSIARDLGLQPEQMIMVGDTVNDMLAGRNAGVSGCIGITGSTGDAGKLAPFADVLLSKVDELIIGS